MAYLIEQPGITRLINVIQPADLITMGSSPVLIYDKVNNLIPFFIVMNLTTGTVPYDFGVTDFFQFQDVNTNKIFDSTTVLQVIQNDEFVAGYARQFKTNSFGIPPFSLYLSTVSGLDATQGDGILTVYTYCINI